MTTQIDRRESIHTILQDRFGYSSFKLLQEEIINHILSDKNALVIMPTGGGKSLCFQIPALIKEGLAIVVSPLIALMKDQVEALAANGIPAAALNSGQSLEARKLTMSAIQAGKLKLLYISPEKAVSSGFLQFIEKQKISMIAIDETHCVSIWGNDFRPEYTELPKLTRLFPDKPVIALTATADKATQNDIVKQLDLSKAKTFLSSFERENLFVRVSAPNNRIKQIDTFLRKHQNEPGIIYCLSRKSTEKVAEKLKGLGYNAMHFHAQMSPDQKNHVQDSFQKDEIQIICATIAFGMGIDKSNIRWVIHYNLPKNIESYYQEIGRSGRDGEPAELLLFSSYGDIKTYREFVFQSDASDAFKKVQLSKIERMWEYAQATSCRTNVILNYFGENKSKPCGHCDNCLNPPVGFDGSIIAQKALSAVKRTRESVPLGLLIDILRGSYRREVTAAGFQEIKTFGAGRHTSKSHWIEYITQLINLGLLEIDYSDHSKLKLTSLADPVLFENKKVTLTQPREWTDSDGKYIKKKSKGESFKDQLTEELMLLRKQIAGEDGIAPFNVFADSTIKEMAKFKVCFKPEFFKLSGMSAYKYERYADRFLDKIREVMLKSDMQKMKGRTYLETLKLFQEGKTISEISRFRDIGRSTIVGHLATLLDKEENIDALRIMPLEDLEKITEVWVSLNKPDQTNQVFSKLEGIYDYSQIKLAISWSKKNQIQITSTKENK